MSTTKNNWIHLFFFCISLPKQLTTTTFVNFSTEGKKYPVWNFFSPIDDFWSAYEYENNRFEFEFITVPFHSRQKLNRKTCTFGSFSKPLGKTMTCHPWRFRFRAPDDHAHVKHAIFQVITRANKDVTHVKMVIDNFLCGVV